MKKKVCFLVAIVVLLLIAIGGYHLHYYFNPNIEIVLTETIGEDLYISSPRYTIVSKSIFGISPQMEGYLSEWAEETSHVDEWLHTYVKPINVASKVEITGGRTVVTYEGTATTKEGDIEDIYKQLTFDFVLTERIP